MKAYEFTARVSDDGTLVVPEPARQVLPLGRSVRLLVLIEEDSSQADEAGWSRLAAEQLLAGYSPGDDLYDRL